MNSRTSPSFQRRARQRGLTLIELLIAIAIGLFILLGLTSVFITTKQTFTAQDQISQLQDNERLALTILTNTIQPAEYFPNPLVTTAALSMPAATGTYGTLAEGQGIVGTSGESDTNDTITSRYIAATGDGVMNCLGETNTSGVNVTYLNTFSISEAHELLCSTDGGTTTTALVSNVMSLHVLYGTDTGNSGNADRYLTAAEVELGSYWPRVRTARVTITVANPFAAQPGQPATIAWTHTISLMNRS